MQELEDRKGARGFVQGASRNETRSMAEKETRGCPHDQAAESIELTDKEAFVDRLVLDISAGEAPIISSIAVEDCAVLRPGAFYDRILTGRAVNTGAHVRILHGKIDSAPVTVPPFRLIVESDTPLSILRVGVTCSGIFPGCSSAVVSGLELVFDVTTESNQLGVCRPPEAGSLRHAHEFVVGMRGVPWSVRPHHNVSGVTRVNFALTGEFLAPLGIRIPTDVGRLRSLCIGDLLSVRDFSQMPEAHQSCGFELYPRMGRMLRSMKC